MRELTIVYKWKDKSEGTFTHPRFPEPIDVARTMLAGIEDETYREVVAQAVSANPTFTAQYWGWFRQVLVTWRADAKRHRVGNDSNAPKSEAEAAVIMAAEKMPVYKEPAEGQDAVAKIAAIAKTLTPAQIADLYAQLGITEIK
jgi:hypothetical protein